MIIKGKSRGNAAQLANYLLRIGKNEQITLLEAIVPGDDPQEAVSKSLAHFDHMAKMTNGTKSLYHAQISPEEQYLMEHEDWSRAADILEENLGYQGQPRVIVIHKKEGRDHIHIVWQRTDVEKKILIPDSMNYPKHEFAAREMEQEFGHRLVKGQFTGRGRDSEGKFLEPRPGYDPETQTYKPKSRRQIDTQRAERAPSPQEEINRLWRRSDSGKAFVAALKSNGYELVRGDKKPIHMLMKEGELYDLRRSLDGVKKKDIEVRLADYPAEKLPIAAVVKQSIERRREDLEDRIARELAEKKRQADLEGRLKAWEEAQQRREEGAKQLKENFQPEEGPAVQIKRVAEEKRRQAEPARQRVTQEASEKKHQKQVTDQPPSEEVSEAKEQWRESAEYPAKQFEKLRIFEEKKRQKAAEARTKFEEQSNEKRAKQQSWNTAERIEMGRRHRRAMDSLMERLEKHYGPEMEKNKQTLANIEKRQQRGGWWYRLVHARKDLERADVAQRSLQSAESRIEEYRSGLLQKQKVEETQLLDRHRRDDKRLEDNISRAAEWELRESLQLTPDPARRHRPRRGPTFDRGGFSL